MADHEQYMRIALEEAERGAAEGNVAVGSVLVDGHKVVARGRNLVRSNSDPTAHAEMIAITAAANTKEDWRLDDCVLYVTKEPCSMCAGAIVNSRMKMVVFGCYDEQEGCCGSLYQLCGDPRFKTQTAVEGGILEDECLSLIQDFLPSNFMVSIFRMK